MFGIGPLEIVALIMTLVIYAGVIAGMGMAIYFIVRKAVRDEMRGVPESFGGESDAERHHD